jgi:hypothetical protein
MERKTNNFTKKSNSKINSLCITLKKNNSYEDNWVIDSLVLENTCITIRNNFNH